MDQQAAGRRFWRLLRYTPPDLGQFVPQGQRAGYQVRTKNATAAYLRSVHHGISVYDSEAGAREKHEAFKRTPRGSPFSHLAVLDIPADSTIVCNDDIGGPGHWDLYSTPDELLSLVTPPTLPL
jgi:hypothetical protein